MNNGRHFEKVLQVVDQARRFGSRTLADGTLLAGHVPHVAPEAWFHQVFPPLSEADVVQLEREILRRAIPPAYRAFLTGCSNGLRLFSGSLSLYGLRRNYIRTGDAVWQPFAIETPNLYERPRDASNSCFFIGGYNWDGSRLYIEGEEVFRCSRRSAEPLDRWEGFWDMLLRETERLSMLFDENGRERDSSVPTTP